MKIKVPNIISLWVEKYYPLLFTIVICVLLYVFRSMPVINYLYISVYDDTFLTAILTALSIIFGFLLTALTTLYQSPSRAVKEIKQVGRFDELISYNKKAVKWVFFSVVFTAVFLLSFKLDSKLFRWSLALYNSIFYIFELPFFRYILCTSLDFIPNNAKNFSIKFRINFCNSPFPLCIE